MVNLDCKKGYHYEGNRCIKDKKSIFTFRNRFMERAETKYITYAFLVVSALTFIILNMKLSNKLSMLNPVAQFFILSIGIFLIFTFVLKSIALGTPRAWEGVLSSILFSMASDILIPEYHITKLGLVSGANFGTATTDYFFGYLLTGFGNVTYPPYILGIMVYVGVTLGLYVLSALLFKNFVRNI